MKIEIITNRSGIFGGLRRLYILADYFIEAGHQAIINIEDKSTNSWFKHSVPENQIINPDIRIIPEVLQKKHPTAKNILYYQAHWDPPEGNYSTIITTSSFLQKRLREEGYDSQIIKYGIDSNIFKPDSSKRIFGTIAYMPRKNSEEATLIKQLIPEFKFVEIEGKIEKEVASLLQQSDIFLALSRLEGFGIPPAEAALCESLCIGYDAKGGADWMNENTYVPCSDPAEIAFKCREAILSRRYDYRRKNARNIILEKYSLQQEKEDWLKLINSLV